MKNLSFTKKQIDFLLKHISEMRESKIVVGRLDTPKNEKMKIDFDPAKVKVGKFEDTDHYFYAETSFAGSNVLNVRTKKVENFRAHFMIVKKGIQKKDLDKNQTLQKFIGKDETLTELYKNVFIEEDEKGKEIKTDVSLRPTTLIKAISFTELNPSQEHLLMMFGKHLMFSYRELTKPVKEKSEPKKENKKVAKTKKEVKK